MQKFKKILEVLINIFTFGFAAYSKYKKNEKKLKALYEGVNLAVKHSKVDGSKVLEIVKTVQINRGVFGAVADDLTQLYKDNILKKAEKWELPETHSTQNK